MPGGSASPPAPGHDERRAGEVRALVRRLPWAAWSEARGKTGWRLSSADADQVQAAITEAITVGGISLAQAGEVGQLALSEARGPRPVAYVVNAFTKHLARRVRALDGEPLATDPLPLPDAPGLRRALRSAHRARFGASRSPATAASLRRRLRALVRARGLWWMSWLRVRACLEMVGVSGWSTRLGCSIVVGMQERPRRYPSDTSDAQWVVIEPLLPPLARRGRPVAHARRDVLDAILYVVRTGCAWRALPVDFPPWQTVYWYFNQWEQQKVTEKILPVVRGQLRIAEGRDPEPSAGIIDSQSVKGADTVGQDSRGYDAGKKTGGRKRFIVTDTLGLLLTTMVCSASVQDRDGAKPILLNLYLRTRVRFVYADAGFAGRLLDWAATILQTTIEIIRKPPEQRGFTVLPRRWVVERTLAWLTAHPTPGPRLRTPPHHIRSHDPLGRDQHHHPPHRPWIPRHPPAETHDTLNPLEFPNTL